MPWKARRIGQVDQDLGDVRRASRPRLPACCFRLSKVSSACRSIGPVLDRAVGAQGHVGRVEDAVGGHGPLKRCRLAGQMRLAPVYALGFSSGGVGQELAVAAELVGEACELGLVDLDAEAGPPPACPSRARDDW